MRFFRRREEGEGRGRGRVKRKAQSAMEGMERKSSLRLHPELQRVVLLLQFRIRVREVLDPLLVVSLRLGQFRRLALQVFDAGSQAVQEVRFLVCACHYCDGSIGRGGRRKVQLDGDDWERERENEESRCVERKR